MVTFMGSLSFLELRSFENLGKIIASGVGLFLQSHVSNHECLQRSVKNKKEKDRILLI
jgi:hypothetical protein